jgi:hypothetical protein
VSLVVGTITTQLQGYEIYYSGIEEEEIPELLIRDLKGIKGDFKVTKIKLGTLINK